MRLGAHHRCRVFNLRHFGVFFSGKRSFSFLKESQEHVEKDLFWKELFGTDQLFFLKEHDFFRPSKQLGWKWQESIYPPPRLAVRL